MRVQQVILGKLERAVTSRGSDGANEPRARRSFDGEETTRPTREPEAEPEPYVSEKPTVPIKRIRGV